MARVLHVCTSSEFWDFVQPFLLQLVARGHEVHVASAAGRGLTVLSKTQGFDAHPIPIRRDVALIHDVQTLLSLSALVYRIRPDIVHSHTPKAGLLGTVSGRLARGPFCIYQMHGLRYETATGAKRRMLKTAERVSCEWAHEVVCVSPSLRERAIAGGVLSASKSRVLGSGSVSGVDLGIFDRSTAVALGEQCRERWGVSRTRLVVGFAGRLARDKGLGELCKAWPEIQRRFPEAHLVLAGAPDPTDPVDLSALSARPEVHFLGHLEDVRPFLGLCSLLVLPSYREGLPQILLEASAVQTPFVATRVTGVVDAVDEEQRRFLIPPQDSRALARAICDALSLTVQGHNRGHELRAFVSHRFAQEVVLRENLDFYDLILQRIASTRHSK